MPLTPCPECGHEVSTKASSCPNCGAPIASAPTATKTSQKAKEGPFLQTLNCGCVVVLGLIALIVIMTVIFGSAS